MTNTQLQSHSARKSTLRRWLPRLILVTLVGCLVGLLLHLHSEGWDYKRIVSGSMEPTIGVNDLIIVGPPHDLQLGDVLLYNDPSKDGRQTAHRLVGYEDDGSFRTKGDNNSSNDRHHIPLTAQHVVGEVKMVLAVPSIDRTSAPFLIALAVFLIALVVIFSGDKRDGGPDQKPVS